MTYRNYYVFVSKVLNVRVVCKYFCLIQWIFHKTASVI